MTGCTRRRRRATGVDNPERPTGPRLSRSSGRLSGFAILATTDRQTLWCGWPHPMRRGASRLRPSRRRRPAPAPGGPPEPVEGAHRPRASDSQDPISFRRISARYRGDGVAPRGVLVRMSSRGFNYRGTKTSSETPVRAASEHSPAGQRVPELRRLLDQRVPACQMADLVPTQCHIQSSGPGHQGGGGHERDHPSPWSPWCRPPGRHRAERCPRHPGRRAPPIRWVAGTDLRAGPRPGRTVDDQPWGHRPPGKPRSGTAPASRPAATRRRPVGSPRRSCGARSPTAMPPTIRCTAPANSPLGPTTSSAMSSWPQKSMTMASSALWKITPTTCGPVGRSLRVGHANQSAEIRRGRRRGPEERPSWPRWPARGVRPPMPPMSPRPPAASSYRAPLEW